MKLHRSVLLALAVAIPFAGCGDDDDDELFFAPLTVDLVTTSAEAIVDEAVTFADGDFFADEFAGAEMELTFTSATTFTASGNGTTISGDITYGSCTFSPPGAPRGFHDPCSIELNTSGRRVTAAITLGSRTSQTIEVPVTVRNVGNGTCELRRGAMIITSTECSTTTGVTGGGAAVVGPNGD